MLRFLVTIMGALGLVGGISLYTHALGTVATGFVTLSYWIMGISLFFIIVAATSRR